MKNINILKVTVILLFAFIQLFFFSCKNNEIDSEKQKVKIIQYDVLSGRGNKEYFLNYYIEKGKNDTTICYQSLSDSTNVLKIPVIKNDYIFRGEKLKFINSNKYSINKNSYIIKKYLYDINNTHDEEKLLFICCDKLLHIQHLGGNYSYYYYENPDFKELVFQLKNDKNFRESPVL